MSNEANLRNFLGRKAREASLSEHQKERESTPNMRQDGDFANTPFKGGSAFEREEPPKDHMRRYWRQFETTPLVREPINAFAQQVVAPGYRVVVETDKPKAERVKPNPQSEAPDPAPGEAEDGSGVLKPEERKKLEEWLETCAIIEKEPDKDLRHMLKKAIIQREVRGTALIEKVYAAEEEDKLYGLAFLNAETVRPNTRPGQPLLLLPNDKPGQFDVEGELPKTERGKTAAYTQYTTSSGYGSEDPNAEDVNNFSIDDVIKLARDADVNEAWGTSRLEAVSAEIEGLKNKMRDQNEAIASKAYPLWLFLFGTEEQPWDRDDINRFMDAHEMDNFHPGLKQGVRGDVDVNTISGEVADVIDYLEFDVDYIMSSMPLPKYALGAFEQKLNASGTKTQERQTQRQLKEARRELEAEFSEVVQQKAKEMFSVSDDKVDKIKFKLGVPGEEYKSQNPNDNNINYNGVKNGQPGSSGTDDPTSSSPGATEPDGKSDASDDAKSASSGSEEENSVWDVELDEAAELGADCPDGDCGHEELADPRLVGTADVERDLADLIAQMMLDFRDSTLQQVRRKYADAPYSASQAFEGLANTRLNTSFRNHDLTDSSEVLMHETVKRTLDTLEQENQSVTLDTNFGYELRQSASRFARNVGDETRTALEDLIHRMDRQLERGADNGETLEAILNRVEETWSDAMLRQRAQVIARMEIQSAIESTKLTEFERSEKVVGVKLVNPCTDSTTQLCSHLAGCGGREGAVASLETGKSVADQWSEQVNNTLLFEGFDPIPPVPPFHYNCRSGLIPVPEGELDDELSQPVSNVEDLEQKYGIEVSDD